MYRMLILLLLWARESEMKEMVAPWTWQGCFKSAKCWPCSSDQTVGWVVWASGPGPQAARSPWGPVREHPVPPGKPQLSGLLGDSGGREVQVVVVNPYPSSSQCSGWHEPITTLEEPCLWRDVWATKEVCPQPMGRSGGWPPGHVVLALEPVSWTKLPW